MSALARSASSMLPMLLASLCACGGPAARTGSDVPRVEAVDLAGVVVDARGTPLAGAEVLACTTATPCGLVAPMAMVSRRTLSDLVGELRPAWPADGASLQVTGPDGRWRAHLGLHDPGAAITVLLTAPGAELVVTGGSPSVAPETTRSIALGPAAPIDLQPSCPGASCANNVLIDIPRQWTSLHGPTLERLAPGAYEIAITSSANAPGEHRGRVSVDTRGASGRSSVAVSLAPTGTGQPIEGRAKLLRGHGEETGNLSVTATCSGNVQRTVVTDLAGRFRIDDVGPPPCLVRILVAADSRFETFDDRPGTVTSLPAHDVEVETRISSFQR